MKTFKFISMTLAAALLMLSACKKSESYQTITDVCGNTYRILKIGEQYWMADNMACANYDTESEAYKAKFYQISISEKEKIAPYYVDGRDKSNWDVNTYVFVGNLTNSQIQKLGLLYNWAAAMGYKTESDANAQTGVYEGIRQGICPNGWHLPSGADWNILKKTIADTYDGGSIDNVGTHMKTATGWYDKETKYVAGDNASGFSALPTGYGYGNVVEFVGVNTHYWSSDANGSNTAYDRLLTTHTSTFDDIYNGRTNNKLDAESVRCVRN